MVIPALSSQSKDGELDVVGEIGPRRYQRGQAGVVELGRRVSRGQTRLTGFRKLLP